MTAAFDETAVRNWLVEYLVANAGCNAEQINRGATMHDLGVGSRDAVVLTGELSELLGRTVSPVEFWQYPTVDALAKFLTGGEPVAAAGPVAGERGGFDEPIAVVGLGCRFPGGISGPESFWQFLMDGRSAVGEVPADRWDWFDDGSPEGAAALAATTRWGSFLSDLDAFDAEFFDIMPREAARMDPQQRLLLEVTHEALEHAGIPAESLAETQTGVFVGACTADYGFMTSDLAQVDAWYSTANALSIIANRVSYFFDFRGPSVTVDTACSSSLVAVHLACQSLRSGDANVALAGGVNLLLSPASTRSFDQAEALSPTGQCHAFDAGADGFVRGEGCGVVVLKRLSDAVADGDRVLAVVRGSAVNQDGRSNGLMAPNPAAQMAVLRSAYAAAGVEPRDVGFVEAHGTGTLLGDPIEARALGTVLGRGRAVDAPLLIGAVKSNLGHTEAAAGVAGFVKTVLALSRGVIPANLGFSAPNPHIPFDSLRLKVVAQHTDWVSSSGGVRRAGVSSFGFGGTNAHVVLESVPESVVVDSPSPAVCSLVVSGRSAARVGSLAGVLADWLESDASGSVGLADVASALSHRRSLYSVFGSVCARDRVGAVAGLRALAAGSSGPGVVSVSSGAVAPGTVFVFSGQGSQWAGMGRRLLADEPVFAAAVAELEPVFVERVGFSLREVLAEGRVVSGDAQVQPVLMGVQLALVALWRHYGVEPDAVVGHSMGELTAAVVAGALTVDEGLRVIGIRSRLMTELAGPGAVALLNIDAAGTEELIADFAGVEVAGLVSPRQTVVAGPVEQVDAVIAAVTASNRFARRVNMEVASHTALMDPVLPGLLAELGAVACKAPTIPFISTVSDPAAGTPVLDAEYWAANVRTPVHFSRAITAAAADYGTFIEVSPHPTMSQAIADCLESVTDPDGAEGHRVIGTLRRDADDTVTFQANVNATCTDYPPVTEAPPTVPVELPVTPWQHTRHWLDSRPLRRADGSGSIPGWATDSAGGIPAQWYCELSWPVRPAPASEPDRDARWLVVADPDRGAGIAAGLGDESTVTVVSPDRLAADPAALAGATHVLYAPDAPADFAAAGAYPLFQAGRRLATAATRQPVPPKLFLLTRNAQPISAGDRANPAQAVLWGLGRTLALEHPEIWGAVVDVDESVPDRVAARWLLAESANTDGEDQVVYRAGVRHVARLRPTHPPAVTPVTLDPEFSYLVIGATGNIGPHVIGQLAAMGARTVVAVSRNPGTRLDELTRSMAERGVTLVAAAADAADEASLGAVFARFGTELPPLGGIYQAAFAGGPVTLDDMTDDDVVAMFRPKMDAVAVAHKLSLDQPVRHFVLFSSISGVLGSRWLAHYAATTTFLDTFAFARRAAGLPATAINWGLWKSLADVQAGGPDRQVTLESGLEPMPDDLAIGALSLVSAPDAPVRSTVVAADWGLLIAAYRTRAALRIVDDLAAAAIDGQSAADARLLEALRECPPEDRVRLLNDEVTALVAAAMGLASPKALDTSVGFFQFGMDSLMSVTLQRSLSENLGQVLPASVVFDYPTVEALAGYLATLLPDMIEAVDEDSADDYDDLAEDELLAKLSERLS